MKKFLFSIAISCLLSAGILSQTVTVVGNKFQVNGKDIFFNGINGPWQYRTDCDINFMRRDFNLSWWTSEFQRYQANRINVVRIWIHGSGNFSPAINTSSNIDAYPSGDVFWQNMDALLNLAATYKIYIMPTFWSFDMVKQGMSSYYTRYRTLIQDDNRIGTYLNNFLIPFVQRYQNNPWIMGYDLCNEPEHMWRDADCGKLNQYWVMRFFARCAAAIHQYGSKPVTIGSMWIIYNSSVYGAVDGDPNAGWNRYTNAQMRSYFDSQYAYLDFYSPHWYQWQNTSGPYERTVSGWLGSDDKPVLIGETYGGNLSIISMANYYIRSYQNGFDGVMGWKNACENDGYGTFAGVALGTNAFYNSYPALVYPYLTGGTTTCNTVNIPGTIQAENYCNMSGIQTENTTDAGGGQNVGWIDAGDWMTYRVNIPTSGTYTVQYRVASQSGGGSIRLERGGGGATYGTISVPSTGGWQTWTTISHSVALTAGTQDLGLVAVAGGFNLNWFSITGGSTGGTTNVAYNKPVFTTSNENTTNIGARAVDANGATRWSSAYSDQQSITVDLQANYNISRVRLAWEAAYARQFQIQVSSNNSTWTTVYSNYNGTGGTTDVNLSTTARYVKMYAWQRATVYGYSLWEFEVYGTLSGSNEAVETAISGVELNGIQVFPNPAREMVTISNIDNDNIVVSDMSGRIIKTIVPDGSSSYNFNVSAWNKGVYFVRSGEFKSKLVVQ